MPSSQPDSTRARLAGVALVLAAVALVNAPVFAGFLGLVRLDDVFYSTDSSTHFVRMMHARDYYLRSGHHWGWDPFWFQGYVPFLLYPHLTYTALAAASALPIEPHRLFNLYALAIYLGLPVAAGLLVRSARGAIAGGLVALWIASASSIYGVGMRGVFHIGLLTQQAGLLVFVAVAYELLFSRRIDRAALWLGVAPLVHVHTAVLAAIAWLAEGALRAMRRDPDEPLRVWLAGSVVAGLIAAPTIAGILVGWNLVGNSTSFPHPTRLLVRLLAGRVLAPWPTLAAVSVCAVAAAILAPDDTRNRARTALLIGVAFVFVALLDYRVDGIVGRTLYYMLRLRTLPYALLWLALLAAWGWPRLPRMLRVAIVALTLTGVPTTWEHTARNVTRLSDTMPRHNPGEIALLETFEPTLRWVDEDAGARTATLALVMPRPVKRAILLRRALEVTGLPMLSGHGLELTSVHNSHLIYHLERLGCPTIQAEIVRYGVGYIVGSELYRRVVLEKCLGREADFMNEAWWVFATGFGWQNFAPIARSFRRNDTWTELSWRLRPQEHETRLVLPVAYTAPWSADINGKHAEISRTSDGLMSVLVPRGSSVLQLRYRAPPGEWVSVAICALGLVLGGTLVAHTRRRRARPS